MSMSCTWTQHAGVPASSSSPIKLKDFGYNNHLSLTAFGMSVCESLTSFKSKLLVTVLDTPSQVWRQTLWTNVKTEVMEEGTKAFVKEVKALPKAVRDEDCFKVGTSVSDLHADNPMGTLLCLQMSCICARDAEYQGLSHSRCFVILSA